MEFMEMGFYLFFTCVFATLFQHPASPVRHLIPNDAVRRACFGISIGATIVAIVSTPWGRQSGGHLNPAMTFEFYRLGKVKLCDAIFYGIAQFAGATAGVAVATSLLLVRRVTLRFGTPQHSPEYTARALLSLRKWSSHLF